MTAPVFLPFHCFTQVTKPTIVCIWKHLLNFSTSSYANNKRRFTNVITCHGSVCTLSWDVPCWGLQCTLHCSIVGDELSLWELQWYVVTKIDIQLSILCFFFNKEVKKHIQNITYSTLWSRGVWDRIFTFRFHQHQKSGSMMMFFWTNLVQWRIECLLFHITNL